MAMLMTHGRAILLQPPNNKVSLRRRPTSATVVSSSRKVVSCRVVLASQWNPVVARVSISRVNRFAVPGWKPSRPSLATAAAPDEDSTATPHQVVKLVRYMMCLFVTLILVFLYTASSALSTSFNFAWMPQYLITVCRGLALK